MEPSALEQDWILSTLGDDPDLGEIVEMFVDEMPERIALLTACRDEEDWQQLGRLAHQLKGSCGSYGFSQLTSQAARLEQVCRSKERIEEQIFAELSELVDMCQRVKAR
jgi:HPt (histidine-containing phosphotransfer) domain-containing protein